MASNPASAYFPIEIITEILVRLPIKPLFQSQCVSKEWKSVISDPKFGRKYMKKAYSSPKVASLLKLWGIFFKKYSRGNMILTRQPVTGAGNVFTIYRPVKGDLRILGSSNGLILCQKSGREVLVTNPVTKMSVEVPLPLAATGHELGFPFRERKIFFATRVSNADVDACYVSYKVVVFQSRKVRGVNKVVVTTFGSDTARWSEEIDVTNVVTKEVFHSEPFHCNGVLHWIDLNERTLVTYAPYDRPEMLRQFQMPSIEPKCRVIKKFVIVGGREDMLKFGEIEDCGGHLGFRLRVWVLLDSNEGNWCLWQTCVIDSDWRKREIIGCDIVAPFPWNEEVFCGMWLEGDKLKARDLGSGRDVFTAGGMVERSYSYFPVMLCPWASPFYGRATGGPSELGEISLVWFPKWSRYPAHRPYPSFFDWDA